MICEKCQKEISDNANFCTNCGYKLKRNNFLKSIMISCVLMIAIFITVASFIIPTTPEYAIYKAFTSIKANDYDETIKYVNIDKIINNRVSAITEEMYSSPELKDNPFAGLAYVFIDTMAEKLKTTIKNTFRNVVLNRNNGFKDISEIKLIYFLTVKSHGDLTLTKYRNTYGETVFTFSDNDEFDPVYIFLDNSTKNHWEIIDITGYNFWENYLED